VAQSAEKLAHIPLTIGDWEGSRLQPRDPRELNEVAGHFYARFVNTRDGRAVVAFVVSGLPGPVSIHEPGDCYQASGFDVGEAEHVNMPAGEGMKESEFLTASLSRLRSAEQTRLRIYWAWNATGAWQVPESPRWTFARAPVLYKLYLLREMQPGEDRAIEDGCRAFMRQFLPVLQRGLFGQ
jgi:hypothetical protein